MYNYPQDGPAALLILVALVLLFLLHRLWNNRPMGRSAQIDASLILTMYSFGVDIQGISKGNLSGLPYSIVMTAPATAGTRLPAGTIRAPIDQIILTMQLPARSPVHIAGFSLENETFRLLLGNTSLENMLVPIRLEGNFPDYFKLYCTPGFDVSLREVLDPATMDFLINFCDEFNWEVFEDSIYFIQTSQPKPAEKPGEGIIAAAQGFSEKVLPTLQHMMTPPALPVTDETQPPT